MSTPTLAARLAELHAAATPGPWNWPFDGDLNRDHRTPDADLVTYLRNHAEAILALVEAGERLDAAWSTADDAMDDDNIVPAKEWDEWMIAHREFRAALEALNG